jgi:4'-phosphopantetheinyl transferase
MDAGIPASSLHRVLETFPPDRRERLRRFRHVADVERGALADVAARRLLTDRTGVQASEIVVRRDSRGAPVVAGDDVVGRYRLSLTHAGRWVAAAVSGHPVGVDVEVVRELTPSAMRWLMPGPRAGAPAGPDPHRQAVRRWTAIEAYLKALGLGLAIDPHEVHLADLRGAGFRVRAAGRPVLEAADFDLDGRHVLAVCGPGRATAGQVRTTTSTDLITHYLAAVATPRWQPFESGIAAA